MDDSYNLEYNEEIKEYRINLFQDTSTGLEPVSRCSKIEFYVLEAFVFTKKRKNNISKQTLIRTLREVRTLLRHLNDYQLHLIRTA